jgi:hypothetical protein
MQLFGEYPFGEFDKLSGGELILYRAEHDQIGMMVIAETDAGPRPRLLELGRLGAKAVTLKLVREVNLFPTNVVKIDALCRFVPDLAAPRPKSWNAPGTLYIGQKLCLAVQDRDKLLYVDVRTGRYVPDTTRKVEYPVPSWSIVLEQPTGPVVLLRHDPGAGTGA